MKKLITTVLCSAVAGLTIFSAPKITGQAYAQSQYAYTTVSTQSSSISYADEIDEMVETGTFDSSSLTKEQIALINKKYGEDPQAIQELQKKSDSIKNPSLASIDTSIYAHDAQFKGYDIINGIDISRWQGNIDWKKVKADGINFALIRVALRTTESGVLEADALYKENIEGALAAGLDVGVYVYSQAITTAEARAEANYTMKLIKGYNIKLPVVMDYEYYINHSGRLARANLSPAAATTICTAFCEEVEKNNYTAMVYANKSLLTDDVYADVLAKRFPIWLAQYPGWDSVTNSVHASYEGKYSYWQYTSSGSVAGISGNVDMNFRYIKKPEAVKNLHITSTSMQKVSLKWDKVPYVYGYKIYRLDKSTNTYKHVGTTVGASNTSFTNKGLEVETLYSYKVLAFYGTNSGAYNGGESNIVHAATQEKNIDKVSIAKRAKDSLTLEWTPQTEVSGYHIVRFNPATGKYKTVAYVKGAKNNTYTDTKLASGTTYTYKVRAYFEEGSRRAFFKYSSSINGNTRPGQATGVTASSTKNTVTVKWNGQINVAGYIVYRLNDNGKWVRIKTITNKNTTSYTDKKLSGNTIYKYCVVAYYKKSGSNVRTDRSKTVSIMTKPANARSVSVIPSKNNSVSISWKSSKNISGYLVYMKNGTTGSSWKRIAKLSSDKTSWTQKGLSANGTYKFKIKTYYRGNGATSISDAATITVKIPPKKVTGVAVNSYGSRQLMTWKAQTDADGYYIYRYTNKTKKYTKLKTITNSAASSYIINEAGSSKYSYCIVAYNKSNGKAYKGTRSALTASKKGSQKMQVICSVLNVRKGPGTGYDIIQTVSYGTELTLKGLYQDWYQISFTKDGRTYNGYVSAAYVKLK